jgi:hypothetical protein
MTSLEQQGLDLILPFRLRKAGNFKETAEPHISDLTTGLVEEKTRRNVEETETTMKNVAVAVLYNQHSITKYII